MELREAMEARHAVRAYLDKPLPDTVVEELQQEIDACNRESGLQIQLIVNEKEAFTGLLARYGKFKNVHNYIALVGLEKDKDLREKCGYYGQRLALKAQMLGLNSCWVAASYKKSKNPAVVKGGEQSLMVIAIGYGQESGVPHKSKAIEELYKTDGEPPEWFLQGVKAAALAPTAMNKQNFLFELLPGNKVRATAKKGMYTLVDLGIAKYQFQIGAGNAVWSWEK